MGFPDVCKTPSPAGPVPIPYPSIGMCNQAKKQAKKVKIKSKPALTMKSEMSRCSGDEAGTAKGVVSSTNMDKVTYKSGSSKVKIEGKKAVYCGSTTGHNGSNANMPAGAQIAPSQTMILIAS